MISLQWKCSLIFITCLFITGAFSLLRVQQETHLQALRTKLLEKKLLSLQQIDKHVSLHVSQLQYKQQALQPSLHARQIIWASQQNRKLPLLSLARNF